MSNIGLNNIITELLKGILIKYPSVNKAILFGSRAKGTARENSDIDIAIIGIDNDLDIEKIAMEFDELPLPYKFDVQAYSRIKNRALSEHIDRVGITIYEKN